MRSLFRLAVFAENHERNFFHDESTAFGNRACGRHIPRKEQCVANDPAKRANPNVHGVNAFDSLLRGGRFDALQEAEGDRDFVQWLYLGGEQRSLPGPRLQPGPPASSNARVTRLGVG